jgi:hypothetical protein
MAWKNERGGNGMGYACRKIGIGNACLLTYTKDNAWKTSSANTYQGERLTMCSGRLKLSDDY